uniref:Uncharacterized protein n=1 Tax=Ascaris lumbricoides TaxID=6252 RepID=A0A0M3HQ29_ASCLU
MRCDVNSKIGYEGKRVFTISSKADTIVPFIVCNKVIRLFLLRNDILQSDLKLLMKRFYILLQYSSEIVCRWIIVCLPMTEVTRTHSIQTTSRIEGQKGEKVYEDKTHYESYIHSYEVIFQMVFNHVVI